MFAEIFAVQNSWLSLDAIWLRVVEEAGQLAEALRTQRVSRLRDDDVLADPLAWLFAFANRLGLNLGEVAWSKFPAVCPYCVVGQADFEALARTTEPRRTRNEGQGVMSTCHCPIDQQPSYDEIQLLIEPFRLRRDLKPVTLYDWQLMFREIYFEQHARREDLDQLGYHLVEELGEVAREVRSRNFDACKLETADVFSWLLSLGTKAGEGIMGELFSIEDVLWRVYQGVCKRCRAMPCSCVRS